MMKMIQLLMLFTLLATSFCYDVRRLSIFNSSDDLTRSNTNNMQVAVSSDVIGFHFPIADKIVYYPKEDFMTQEIMNANYYNQYVKE